MTSTRQPSDTVIDVRAIIPRDRHHMIFNAFYALEPGYCFILVNDHDPKPFYYKFQAEYQGQFGWDYLDDGPDVWRVRITRLS